MKLFSIPARAAQAAQVVTQLVARDGSVSHSPASTGIDPLDVHARRRLAGVLREQRGSIAASWTARHLALREVSEFVARVTGGTGEAEFYRTAYVSPLLELLRGAIAGTLPAWRAVYLDERTRFLVPAEVRVEAHEEVLERLVCTDVADLVERLPADLQPAAHTILTTLHAPLTPDPRSSPVRLLLIGDCVMTELRAFLTEQCAAAGAPVRIRHQYLSFDRGVGLDMSGVMDHVNSGAVDLIALSFFTFEGLPLYRALLADAARLSQAEAAEKVTGLVRMVRTVIASLRTSSDVPILLHSACGLPLSTLRRRLPFLQPMSSAKRAVLDRLNHEIYELASGMENVVLIDEPAIVKASGPRRATANIFSRRLRKRALFHTSAFGPMLAQAYVPAISAYARLRHAKVLLVDFDNTLWSGVMADGEVEQHVHAQRVLQKVREAGILLVALSKNDPQSIRWAEMLLTPEDFVLHKISWNHKVASIEEAAQQLELGLDSFAVIDDNPVERALIADRFPQIELLDPASPDTWSSIELMLSFPNTRQTQESAARTALYREAAGRREAMVAELDYPSMMASLQLRATWSRARAKDLPRIHELLQRTNQFNTTTKRRSLAELRSLIVSAQHRVFVFSLGDRFGDLGVVGVVILECAGEQLVFDAVIMSCRAMGFGLEALLIRAPLEHTLIEDGTRRPARGLYYPNERNEPAASVFARAGFSADGDSQWLLPAVAPLPEVPQWLTVSLAASDR